MLKRLCRNLCLYILLSLAFFLLMMVDYDSNDALCIGATAAMLLVIAFIAFYQRYDHLRRRETFGNIVCVFGVWLLFYALSQGHVHSDGFVQFLYLIGFSMIISAFVLLGCCYRLDHVIYAAPRYNPNKIVSPNSKSDLERMRRTGALLPPSTLAYGKEAGSIDIIQEESVYSNNNSNNGNNSNNFSTGDIQDDYLTAEYAQGGNNRVGLKNNGRFASELPFNYKQRQMRGLPMAFPDRGLHIPNEHAYDELQTPYFPSQAYEWFWANITSVAIAAAILIIGGILGAVVGGWRGILWGLSLGSFVVAIIVTRLIWKS